MSLTTIVVYAFNPILLQPDKAFLVWGQFGMLLGVALYLSNKPDSKPGTAVTASETTSSIANSKVATTMMITKKDE